MISLMIATDQLRNPGSLVGVMLAYQLVAGPEPIGTPGTSHMIIAGLVAMVGGILVMPLPVLQTSWFSGLLVGVDTILVTATIYLSGHARSDLYLPYFILMLIAASARRFSHVIAFSLLLGAGYGFVLYQAVAQGSVNSLIELLTYSTGADVPVRNRAHPAV